jgi:hypothetical protein
MSEPDRACQHPYLRLSHLIHTILSVRWDAETWPQAKAALGWALAERSRIARAGWFIHENAPSVKAVLSDLPAAASINHPFAQSRA